MPKDRSRVQSAIEYLTSYAWALIILVLLGIGFFLYYTSAYSSVGDSCSFTDGVTCQDLVMGTNSYVSKLVVIITNSQPFSLVGPSFAVNISGIGEFTGGCTPGFALPGGAILCNFTVPEHLANRVFLSGQVYLYGIPCQSGNPSVCKGGVPQNYTGTFATHVISIVSNSFLNFAFSVNTLSPTANNASDSLYATVKLNGDPITGATVTFNAMNDLSLTPVGTISIPIINTASNGVAMSSIEWNQTGSVLVTAAYGNYTNSIILQFH